MSRVFLRVFYHVRAFIKLSALGGPASRVSTIVITPPRRSLVGPGPSRAYIPPVQLYRLAAANRARQIQRGERCETILSLASAPRRVAACARNGHAHAVESAVKYIQLSLVDNESQGFASTNLPMTVAGAFFSCVSRASLEGRSGVVFHGTHMRKVSRRRERVLGPGASVEDAFSRLSRNRAARG